MGDPIRLTEAQGRDFEAQVKTAQKEKGHHDEPQKSEERGGGFLASLKKGFKEGHEEEKQAGEERRRKRKEERRQEYLQTPPSPTGKLIGKVAAKITQHGPPSAAEERLGQIAHKVANAGARTIGKAVVVGGSRLIAAGKRGLENAAVNRGVAVRTRSGRVVRAPGADFMGAIGGNLLADDLLMGPPQGRRNRMVQPPRGPNPMAIGAGLSDDLLNPPQPRPQAKKGHGGQDIHIHVHTGESSSPGTKKRRRGHRGGRRPSSPEGGPGGGFTLF